MYQDQIREIQEAIKAADIRAQLRRAIDEG